MGRGREERHFQDPALPAEDPWQDRCLQSREVPAHRSPARKERDKHLSLLLSPSHLLPWAPLAKPGPGARQCQPVWVSRVKGSAVTMESGQMTRTNKMLALQELRSIT